MGEYKFLVVIHELDFIGINDKIIHFSFIKTAANNENEALKQAKNHIFDLNRKIDQKHLLSISGIYKGDQTIQAKALEELTIDYINEQIRS